MSYRALRLVAVLVRWLPRPARSALGAILAWIAGSLLRIRRGLVEDAMRRAGVGDPARTSRGMYAGLGRGLVDLVWLASASPSDRENAVASVHIDPGIARVIDDAIASRRPVVVFASHTGNWELAAAAAARLLASRGKRLHIVAKAMRNGGVERFITELRSALGVSIITAAGAWRSAQTALKMGDVVVLPIDQVPDRTTHAVSLPFLGADAHVDRAPATLAWRAGATVMVVAASQGPDGTRLHLLGVPLQSPRPLLRREWIASTTAVAKSGLDAFVRATPESWFWLHRRWRPPRDRGSSGACPTTRFS